MRELYLGIDIGGTKLAAGVVDENAQILVRDRVPTPTRDVWPAVVRLVKRVLAASPERPIACGVGCGGPMAPLEGTVSPLHIPSWRGFPLREFAEQLTGMPVVVDNDAKALALAEAWRGAAVGVDDFIGMVVGTGVGGGIVSGGRLLQGRLGNAGHIGHVVVEPNGRRCSCGSRGCLEAEASGRAIEAITGRPPSEPSYEIMQRTGELVGRAVASVCNLLDLDLVVVGGSVALGFGATFFNSAQAELDRHARLDFSRGARVTPARLGDKGPLIGAGAVGLRGLRRRARSADR